MTTDVLTPELNEGASQPQGIKNAEKDDEKNLIALNRFISNDNCVLLLGPLFGIDGDGNKIHVKLKEHLASCEDKFELDDEFDNLSISKKSDGSQKPALINEICNFYEGARQNVIYEKILDIKFRAIITHTCDLFLYDSDKDHKYDFSFFSKKGTQPVETDGASPSLSGKPVIYNIFGNIGNVNTLITDYDSLYDFLINILRAEQEFPLQLRDILGKASAFLFLGFDLTRWYIPLLVRKLNQFILNARPRTSVYAYACLDDSRKIAAESVTDSLNKYPLSFVPFKTLNSIELINKLHSLERKNGSTMDTVPALTSVQREFFQNWKVNLLEGGYDGMRVFFEEYKELNYRGLRKSDIEGIKIIYNQVVQEKTSFLITKEEYNVACQNMVLSLLSHIDKIL